MTFGADMYIMESIMIIPLLIAGLVFMRISQTIPASAISRSGIDFIKRFESLSLTPYDDVGGKPTIGYGHLITGDDNIGKRITRREANALLLADLNVVERAIQRYVSVALSIDQYNALASFIFNVGVGAFSRSTLLRKLNARDYYAASREFLRWDKVGVTPVAGLTRRRAEERDIFVRGIV